jgi:hypothetical protein
MTEHSPEAMAAYPDANPFDALSTSMTGIQRTALDRGIAIERERKLTTTREAIARVIGEFVTHHPILSLDGPNGEYWLREADAIFAAGILTEPGKPVVNVGELANIAAESCSNSDFAARLTAPDGPLRDEREVKAEALDEAADAGGLARPFGGMWMPDDLRSRAAEIREGRA